MFHKIPVKDLQLGMFVVDLGVSWLLYDELYSQQGSINSREHLESIREHGYKEAFVDLKRSSEGVLPPGIAEVMDEYAVNPFSEISFKPTVSLDKELIRAKSVYSDTLNKVSALMLDFKEGKASVEKSEPIVNEIISSLNRNPDALFTLCKLRHSDQYTYAHSVNVSVLALLLAKGLGAPAELQRIIGIGALFHDLGKALIPSDIINAPRKLTTEEFALMMEHPMLGYNQLVEVGGIPNEILRIVVEHHEKYNGEGYPSRLTKSKISTEGSMVGLVDIFDALTSKRSYKKEIPMGKALSIIFSLKNQAFHSVLVDRFIKIVGIYPIGSAVLLSNGFKGIVIKNNEDSALRPEVMLVRDHRDRPIMHKSVDLSGAKEVADDLKIVQLIPEIDLGISPAEILGLPVA